MPGMYTESLTAAQLSAVPAGCFCRIIKPVHGACLQCTCPGCGSSARYGRPIAHGSAGRPCPGE